MTNFDIDPKWIGMGALAVVLLAFAFWGLRAYQRRSRRRALLSRLGRIAFEAAHQVLVPDGMGGFIHIDHLLLTPRGVLVLDTQPPLYLRQPPARAVRPDRGGQGAGRRCARGRPPALLQRRKIHQGHSEVGADARRYRSAISRRRPGHEGIARIFALRRRMGQAGRAAAAEPAPLYQSLRPSAPGSPSPKKRIALRVVEAATASAVSPRSWATVPAMCGR
jgi:hypothetical protein